MIDLQPVIAQALLSGIARHAQSAGGVVVRIEPAHLPPRGTPTLVTGFLHLNDIAAEIATATLAAQAATTTPEL
jgi:hypothetical protein